MAKLKIGLVQMLCQKGEIAENIEQITRYLSEAVEQGVDFLCFPEMSITGYIDPTRYPQAILHRDSPAVQQVIALTCDNTVTLSAGLVEANPAGKPFITQLLAYKGKLIGWYRKINIVDQEALWFSPGSEVVTFHHPKINIGLAVCADIDRPDIFARLKQAGAQLVFEAAAPGLYGSQENRNWQSGFDWWRGECQTKLARYARDNGLFIAVATQAGRTVDEDFPGGGYLFSSDGSRTVATPDWSSGVLYTELEV
jgi:predicted amidohydrolase